MGGNGIPSLGGCGGHGGDVYIVASKNPSLNLKTFKDLHPTKRFAADAGQSSRLENFHCFCDVLFYLCWLDF